MEAHGPSEWTLVLTLEAMIFSATGLFVGSFDAQTLLSAWVPLLTTCGVVLAIASGAALATTVLSFYSRELPFGSQVLRATDAIDLSARRAAFVVTLHAWYVFVTVLISNSELEAGIWLQGRISVEQRTWVMYVHAVCVLSIYLLAAVCLLIALRGRQDVLQFSGGTQLSGLFVLIFFTAWFQTNVAASAAKETEAMNFLNKESLTFSQLKENRISYKRKMSVLWVSLSSLAAALILIKAWDFIMTVGLKSPKTPFEYPAQYLDYLKKQKQIMNTNASLMLMVVPLTCFVIGLAVNGFVTIPLVFRLTLFVILVLIVFERMGNVAGFIGNIENEERAQRMKDEMALSASTQVKNKWDLKIPLQRKNV